MAEKKILIVDDDPDILNLLRHFLIEKDYQVITTEKAKEVSSIIENEIPDLVISDILMPDINGLLLIKELTHKYKGLKILAMSEGGSSDAKDIVASIVLGQAMHFGAKYAFQKPIEPKEFLKVIDGVLNDKLDKEEFKT
tara:strand:- start:7006 stop:7422 length:417 start_codon:yes stop_codon:yes gene_type:complete